jgi:hypothetical protein
MRILFINGRLPLPFYNGGDGISLMEWVDFMRSNLSSPDIRIVGSADAGERMSRIVRELGERSVSSPVLTNEYFEYTYDNAYRATVYSRSYFDAKLLEIVQERKPDIILTQINDSHRVIEVASDLKIPVIHFVHDCDPLNMRSISRSSGIYHVFFNSHYVASKYKSYVRCPWSVLYPSISTARHVMPTRSKTPSQIVMFNPVNRKGSRIIRELAFRSPNHNFRLVEGKEPVDVDVASLKNVMVCRRSNDVRLMLEDAIVTLVPSQYEEAFGRVVIESQINGIPVIASDRGGLPEAVGAGGILVKKYDDVSEWMGHLTAVLQDSVYYNKLAKLAEQNASKFLVATVNLDLIEKIREAVHD